MKNKIKLSILSTAFLTAGLINLSMCQATEVLRNDPQTTSQSVSFEDFKEYFDQNYAYQASQCAELKELQSLGKHDTWVKNIFNNIDKHLQEDESATDATIYFRLLLAYIREGAKWAYQRGGPIEQETRAAKINDNEAIEKLGYNEEEFTAFPQPLFILFEKLDPISWKIINYLEKNSSHS